MQAEFISRSHNEFGSTRPWPDILECKDWFISGPGTVEAACANGNRYIQSMYVCTLGASRARELEEHHTRWPPLSGRAFLRLAGSAESHWERGHVIPSWRTSRRLGRYQFSQEIRSTHPADMVCIDSLHVVTRAGREHLLDGPLLPWCCWAASSGCCFVASSWTGEWPCPEFWNKGLSLVGCKVPSTLKCNLFFPPPPHDIASLSPFCVAVWYRCLSFVCSVVSRLLRRIIYLSPP